MLEVIVKKMTYSTFHLLTETDPSGLVTTFEYNAAGQKIVEKKGRQTTRFEYDRLGRVAKIRNDTNELVSTYDLLGRLIEERLYDLDGALHSQVKWAYDPLGRKTHTWTTTDDGVRLDEKRYNTKGDLIWHKDNAGHVTTHHFIYDAVNEFGQKTPRHEMIDPLGRKVITVCDALGRTVSVEKRGFDDALLQKKIFAYNSAGERVRSTEIGLQGSLPQKEVINEWSWDSVGQLIAVTEAVGTPEQKRTRYRYNLYGQKTEVVKPDGQSIFYGYDANGRVQTLKAEGLEYKYVYDVMGRPVEVTDLLTGKSTCRAYDVEHHLDHEELANGLSLSYYYHPSGQLDGLCCRIVARFAIPIRECGWPD